MKKIYLFAAFVLVILMAGCMAPVPMTAPPPPPEPTGSGNETFKKKMCVGHTCRKIGAIDGGGTTRGHTDDETD